MAVMDSSDSLLVPLHCRDVLVDHDLTVAKPKWLTRVQTRAHITGCSTYFLHCPLETVHSDSTQTQVSQPLCCTCGRPYRDLNPTQYGLLSGKLVHMYVMWNNQRCKNGNIWSYKMGLNTFFCLCEKPLNLYTARDVQIILYLEN